MSAYLVVNMKVNGFNWLAEYQEHVPRLVRSYGGEYIAIPKGLGSEHIERIDGSGPLPDIVVIFRFPSVAAARNFFESPEYLPYKRMREAESETDAFAFENNNEAPQFVGQA